MNSLVGFAAQPPGVDRLARQTEDAQRDEQCGGEFPWPNQLADFGFRSVAPLQQVDAVTRRDGDGKPRQYAVRQQVDVDFVEFVPQRNPVVPKMACRSTANRLLSIWDNRWSFVMELRRCESRWAERSSCRSLRTSSWGNRWTNEWVGCAGS